MDSDVDSSYSSTSNNTSSTSSDTTNLDNCKETTVEDSSETMVYESKLLKLNDDQITQLWDACYEAGLVSEMPDDAEDVRAGLMTRINSVELVDLIVACGSLADGSIIETLMGQPITRKMPNRQSAPHTRPNGSRSIAPRTASASGPRIPAPPKNDNRVISDVKPNPKKPSSAAYQRYQHYKDGMTVQEFIAAGGTPGDIKYDVSKGFIILSPAADGSSN